MEATIARSGTGSGQPITIRVIPHFIISSVTGGLFPTRVDPGSTVVKRVIDPDSRRSRRDFEEKDTTHSVRGVIETPRREARH